MTDFTRTLKIVAFTLLLTALTVGFGASLVLATDVYLLAFLAVLTAVMFANLAKWLGQISPLSYGVNLGITVGAALLIVIGTISFFGLRIEQQIAKTSEEVDRSVTKLESWLEKHPPVQSAMSNVPLVGKLLQTNEGGNGQESNKTSNENGSNNPQETSSDNKSSNRPSGTSDNGSGRISSGQQTQASNSRQSSSKDGGISTGWSNVGSLSSMSGRVFGIVGKLFSTTFGVAMNIAFVLFVGVFLAIKPLYYRDNFTLLFPSDRRRRVREILDDMGDTLFNWLQGRAATMVITGIGTALVLWFLGVPLAFTLGVVTGILTFIPNIGSLLALMLSMLIAFSQGPSTVMWVVIAYGVLQFVESNVITPLIQQHQTAVPPPLLLTAQLMMGVLTGFLGVLVATPLIAAAIVLVREAYVKDVLGHTPESDEEASSAVAA